MLRLCCADSIKKLLDCLRPESTQVLPLKMLGKKHGGSKNAIKSMLAMEVVDDKPLVLWSDKDCAKYEKAFGWQWGGAEPNETVKYGFPAAKQSHQAIKIAQLIYNVYQSNPYY